MHCNNNHNYKHLGYSYTQIKTMLFKYLKTILGFRQNSQTYTG